MDKESKELQALHAQQRAQQAWIKPESSDGCFKTLFLLIPTVILLGFSYWFWPLTIAFILTLVIRYRLAGSWRESLILGLILYGILLGFQHFVFNY